MYCHLGPNVCFFRRCEASLKNYQSRGLKRQLTFQHMSDFNLSGRFLSVFRKCMYWLELLQSRLVGSVEGSVSSLGEKVLRP